MAEKNLAEIVASVRTISNLIKENDYTTAAFAIELLPKEHNRDPLYAGLVVALTRALECEVIGDKTKAEVEKLIDVYKSRCSYFKK